jgi:hypothetical protein
MSRTPTLRIVLDVNVLLDALYAVGPIGSLDELADLDIPAAHRAANALRVVRTVALAARGHRADLTVHVAPHVWSMTARKLVHPTNPAQLAWTVDEARASVRILFDAFRSMAEFGWTTDAEYELSRQNLATVVPTSFYGGRYDIDNEDRSVLLGLVAAAELPARDERPVMTVLVTNDGGLQLADGWVSTNYTSTNGHTLPASVKIMFPRQVATLVERMVRPLVMAA